MSLSFVEVEKLGVFEWTRDTRKAELAGSHPGEVWALYGGGYDTTFSYLLGGESIANIISQRPMGKRRILDLMGPGQVIKNINSELSASDFLLGEFLGRVLEIIKPHRKIKIDGGMAVTLVNPDSGSAQKETNTRLNIHIMEADFYHPSTAEKIRMKMDQVGFDSFDLIVCRPMGPFTRIPDMKAKRVMYQRLFGNLLAEYSALLAEGGILLTQIPYGLIRNQLTEGGIPYSNLRPEYHKMLYGFCQEQGLSYEIAPQGIIPCHAGIGIVLRLDRVGSEGFEPPTSSM